MLPWPTARRDAGRTAYLPECSVRPPIRMAWKQKVPGCGAGGCSDGEILPIPMDNGDIVALAVKDGSMLWRMKRKRGAWSAEVLAVDDRNVYCNSGEYAVALSKHTGEELWCTRVPHWPPAPGTSAVSVGDYLGIESVVFRTQDGLKIADYHTDERHLVQEVAVNSDVWCMSFNLVGRAQPPRLLKYPCGSQTPTVSLDIQASSLGEFVQSSGLLVHSAREPVTDQEDVTRLVVRDAETGKMIRLIPEWGIGTPAIAGSRLFLQHHAKHLAKQPPSPRTLVAYDLDTGNLLWECNDYFRDPCLDDVLQMGGIAPIVAGRYVWHSYSDKSAQGKWSEVLLAIDMDTGVPAWRTVLTGNRLGHLIATEERVIYIREGEVCCFVGQDLAVPAREGVSGKGAAPARVHAPPPGARTGKKAPHKPSGGGRKPVRHNRQGVYGISSGRALVIAPAEKPRALRMREADGQEHELFVLQAPDAWIEDIDVHADAGTAVLKPCVAEGGRQEIFVFDGSAVQPLEIGQDYLSCIAVAISPDGGRVACAFTFPDEPGEAQLRVFEIATRREVVQLALDDETILAANLSWRASQALRFTNVNPGHETEGRQFEADMETLTVRQL